jgi:hypothetical protein
MSNMEKAKAGAEAKAQIDFAKGLESDPGRHQSRRESAWATWYLEEYKRLENKVHKKQFENILKRFA